MRLILVLLAASLYGDEIAPPIEGLQLTDLSDSFDARHFGRRHEAIDIMQPRGTPVHAVATGTIAKLFQSKAGGITIYQFDAFGAYCYYYAHLDRYAEGLQDGSKVEKGQVIGYVGSTGNAAATAPHLHFAVSKLGPEKQWWRSIPVNPYRGLVEAVRQAR
jgi:murein DD-endopeptidase MepM/ murein hydrolase activator NlpD